MKKKYSRILGVALTLVLLASFFGFATPVSADNVAWSGVANPSARALNLADCDVGPIAVTPDGNTLFAAVEAEAVITGISTAAGQGALLKSTDGGHNWSATGLVNQPAPITGIAVSPNFATDGLMYVASGVTVFRSADGGVTFIALKPIIDSSAQPITAISSIDMWPATPSSPYPYIMVGTDRDVMVLKDAVFEDWRDQELNADARAVAFAPDFATTNYIWAVTVAGVVTTTNSPGAWGTLLANTGVLAVPANACVAFPSDYSSLITPYLWVGIDSGALDTGGVWRVRGLPLPGPSHIVKQYGIALTPATAWDIRSLAVSGPMVTATILAGQQDNAAVVGSLNGGITWALPVMKQPTGTGVTYVVMAPDFATSNLAYVGTSDFGITLAVSGVGSATWDSTLAVVGTYSAKLIYTSGNNAYVEFVPAPGTTMNNLSTLVGSFWYNGSLPNLELRFTAPDCVDADDVTSLKRGHVDVNVLATGVTTAWVNESVTGTSSAMYFGNEPNGGLPLYGGAWSGYMALNAILAHVNAAPEMVAAVEVANNWELTRVRLEIGWGSAATCYIDDITIGGVTYPLEPLDSALSAFQVSGNAGMSWNQTGLIDTTIATINDVAVVSLDTIFMVTDNSSLWKTEDATARAPVWERILTPATATWPGNVLANIALVGASPDFLTDGVLYVTDNATGIMKSTDGGDIFAPMGVVPAGGPIFSLHVVDVTFAFVGSAGQVYRTDDGGYSWLAATVPPASNVVSIATSPNYATDGTLLIGNNAGAVYMSTTRGAVFTLMPGSTVQISGDTYVAFDPDYSAPTNMTFYAAGVGTTNAMILRLDLLGTRGWEDIDSSMPATSTINGLLTSPDGTLYGSNALPVVVTPGSLAGGVERSLDPTRAPPPLWPTFERMNRQLPALATLDGLWLVVDETLDVVGSKNVLFSIDTTGVYGVARIVTFTDTLATPVVLAAPENGAVFPREGEVTLEWETLTGALMYQWQVARDARFILIADQGFSGYPTDTSVALSSGRTYYWRVRVAMDSSPTTTPTIVGAPLFSRWSETRTFTTLLGERPWHPFFNIGGVAPGPGAQDVLTKPTFQWNGADWATSYQLVLADNAAFTGATTKTLTTTSWVSDTDLGYSTTWYWKVIALSATSESEWSDVGVFTTMAEPAPPVVVEEVQPPVIEVIIPEQPAAVEVTPVAPAYLLAMIIIGAVLVIFVIVLIVRTRRPV